MIDYRKVERKNLLCSSTAQVLAATNYWLKYFGVFGKSQIFIIGKLTFLIWWRAKQGPILIKFFSSSSHYNQGRSRGYGGLLSPIFSDGACNILQWPSRTQRKKCGVPAVGLESRSSDRRPYDTIPTNPPQNLDYSK